MRRDSAVYNRSRCHDCIRMVRGRFGTGPADAWLCAEEMTIELLSEEGEPMTTTPGTMTDALPPIERVREEQAKLAEAGVRYVFSCWIDMHGLPKTKPVPISDFENLCMGMGPQFAVHSISFVPELGRSGLRPDPGARPRFPGHLPLGPDLRLECSRISGGRTRPTTCVPARRSSACHGRCRGEGLRGIRGDRARVHRDALAVTASRSRRSTTIPSPAKACGRGVRPSATTSSTPSIPWAFSARSSTSSRTSAGD